MSASWSCRMAGRVWIQDHHASGHPPGGPRGSASCRGAGQTALKKPGCDDSHQPGLPSCGLLSAATWRESPWQNRLFSAEGPVRPPGWALGGAWETRSWLLPARGPRVAACLHHLCGLGCRNPSREAGRSAGDSAAWERLPIPGAGLGCGSPRQQVGGHPSGLIGGCRQGRGCQSPSVSPISPRAIGTSERRAGRGCFSILFFSISLHPFPVSPAPEHWVP